MSQATTAPRPRVTDWATDFDILDPAWMRDPYVIFDDLRERCPVAHTERFNGAYLPCALCRYPRYRLRHRQFLLAHRGSARAESAGARRWAAADLRSPAPSRRAQGLAAAIHAPSHRQAGPQDPRCLPAS